MRDLDVAFLVLLLVAFAVQIPLAWFMWSTDSSARGLVRGSAIAGFVVPVVIAVILLSACIALDNPSLRVMCWYGTFVIVGKAIIILTAFLSLIPIHTIYSTASVQAMYPLIPLVAIAYRFRTTMGLNRKSLAIGVIGGLVLGVLFVYLDFLVLFFFYPLL